MNDSVKRERTPRAMIHQRIMDVAADRPDAPVDALAADVPGASPEMVERVLDEYGDPADDSATGDAMGEQGNQSNQPQGHAESTEQNDPAPTTAEQALEPDPDKGHDEPDRPSLASLSEKQRETLYAIRRWPEATQRELGSLLNVTAATISQRVSGIPDFNWSDRAAFADAVIDAHETAHGSNPDDDPTSDIDDETLTDGDVEADSSSTDSEGDTPSSNPRGIVTDRDAKTITLDVGDLSVDSPPVDQGDNEANGQATPTATESEGASAVETASDGGTVPSMDAAEVDVLVDRLDTIESRLDEFATDRSTSGESVSLDDPDLIARVVRACMAADDIDEAEERHIIATLLK